VLRVNIQVKYRPGASPDEHDKGAHYEDAEEAVEHVERRLFGALYSKNVVDVSVKTGACRDMDIINSTHVFRSGASGSLLSYFLLVSQWRRMSPNLFGLTLIDSKKQPTFSECRSRSHIATDSQSAQSVLVSGTQLGPVTNFSFSLKYPSDSCVLLFYSALSGERTGL
jgi:hypothetical protein